MNWDAIGASGEVLGAVVVVASVIYLGIQIKHNTRASRDEAYRDIFTAVSAQFSKMAEPENNEVLLKGLANFTTLTPSEKFQFDSLMCAWMTLLESSVISNDLVGPDGRDILRAGKSEELLIADIDKNTIARERETNPVLKDLRPDLYHAPVKTVGDS